MARVTSGLSSSLRVSGIQKNALVSGVLDTNVPSGVLVWFLGVLVMICPPWGHQTSAEFWAGIWRLWKVLPLKNSGYNIRSFIGLCTLYWLKLLAPMCLTVYLESGARVLGNNFFFTYFRVDFPLLVYAPRPLLVQCCSARRFMSGLTLKTSHCVLHSNMWLCPQ